MKEEYVSYECAVKLKELGFDWGVNSCYIINKIFNIPHLQHYTNKEKWNTAKIGGSKYKYTHISAPRLDQAQAWLRDKGIHISVNLYMDYDVDADGELYNEYPSWSFELMDVASAEFMNDAEGKHDSYESALSTGIDKALELLTVKLNKQ